MLMADVNATVYDERYFTLFAQYCSYQSLVFTHQLI
jgi:hypothetical protein